MHLESQLDVGSVVNRITIICVHIENEKSAIEMETDVPECVCVCVHVKYVRLAWTSPTYEA